jgi:NAD(P)-dependent dehydrogenase (short-subunit alcohol dehydrogenase family)
MATAVITGGTDGIGRALAGTYLERGHEVLVVGTSAEKGKTFQEYATSRGVGERARFLRADLSRVAENHRVIEWITERYPEVDVLVLGARFHRSTRAETPDGFESNFALFYLSRYLLSHGLAALLGRAEHPVVLNFGGAGRTGPVRWDDLQLRRNYPGTGTLGHSGALCDLLGVHFTNVHADSPIHYVLNHPGVVATSFAGEYDAAAANAVEHLRTSGKPVAQAVAQILPFLDAPPARLTAVLEGARVATDTAAFDPAEAARLHQLTEELLAGRGAREGSYQVDRE